MKTFVILLALTLGFVSPVAAGDNVWKLGQREPVFYSVTCVSPEATRAAFVISQDMGTTTLDLAQPRMAAVGCVALVEVFQTFLGVVPGEPSLFNAAGEEYLLVKFQVDGGPVGWSFLRKEWIADPTAAAPIKSDTPLPPGMRAI